MDLSCHRGVAGDAGLYGRVAVRLGRVVLPEGDIGRGFALVRQSPCLEVANRLITVCTRLQRKPQGDYKLCKIVSYNREIDSLTYLRANARRFRLP